MKTLALLTLPRNTTFQFEEDGDDFTFRKLDGIIAQVITKRGTVLLVSCFTQVYVPQNIKWCIRRYTEEGLWFFCRFDHPDAGPTDGCWVDLGDEDFYGQCTLYETADEAWDVMAALEREHKENTALHGGPDHDYHVDIRRVSL